MKEQLVCTTCALQPDLRLVCCQQAHAQYIMQVSRLVLIRGGACIGDRLDTSREVVMPRYVYIYMLTRCY
jgi:hypothetical protein